MPNIPQNLDFPRVTATAKLEEWTQAFHKVLQRQWTMMAQALNAVWKVDTLVNRSSVPLLDEAAFYARDEGVTYLGVQGAWRVLTGWSGTVASITSSSTIVADIGTVLVNATSGNVTVSLSTIAARVFAVKRTDSSANSIFVQAISGTIDGATSSLLVNQYDGIMVISDGSNLFILADYP